MMPAFQAVYRNTRSLRLSIQKRSISQSCSSNSRFSPAMFSLGTATSDKLEFRSYDDDAWYSVQVKLEGDVLRIRYCEFSDEHDNVFNANDFSSFSEVDNLEARFRPLSMQLQDSECCTVNPGMAVCASYSSRHGDVRFYDALVEGVDYLEHSYANGEEECSCNFILFWQHGPNSGNLTVASIADLCQMQAGALPDALLSTFFRKARETIQIRLNKGHSHSEGRSPTHNCGACHKENCSPKFKHKLSFLQRMKQETRCAKRSTSNMSPCKDQQTLSPRSNERIEQDVDIGGMKHQYMVLLENLDRGLSPLRLSKFLHGQTSILPRVYIFPSLSSELYARGAIVLNCKKKLERLYSFLDNPDHVVVSSQGRPLVVTGKMARHETFGSLAGATELDTDNKLVNENDTGVCSELKVLSRGTKEYIIAKQMKELFMEFLSHQRRLHQRLAMEESKIYCSDPLQYKM